MSLQSATQKAGDDPETDKAFTVILDATPSMQYMRLEGEPILQLPESEKKETDES